MRQPSVRFSWQAPTHLSDNTPITDTSVMTYRLYEDKVLAVDDIAVVNFELLMQDRPHKRYTYTVTAVRNGLESVHSNEVFVDFIPPNAPSNLEVVWFDSFVE